MIAIRALSRLAAAHAATLAIDEFRRSPMDARGFTTLAPHLADRTVVTYDPRGVARAARRRSPSASGARW